MPRRPNGSQGAALVVAMVLLLVLAVLGTAAVSLAARDRNNASSQARYQRLVECASAAQSMIWAQLARYGTNYIGSSQPVGTVTLPDGTALAAPRHYGQNAATTFANVAYRVTSGGGAPAVADQDCSNRMCGQGGGNPNPVVIVARCTDPYPGPDGQPRQYEVEMSFVFAL